MTVLGSTQGASQTAQGVTSQNYVVANDEPLNVTHGATPTVTVDDPSADVEAVVGGVTEGADLKATTDVVVGNTVRGVEGD